jgi:hypothetical protein
MKNPLLVPLGVALGACYALLPSGVDALATTVAILLLAFLFYMLAVYARARGRLVLVLALAQRALLWTREPELSDDVHRYRWEGRVQLAGGNPYLARPNDPEWKALHDPRVPAPDFRAGYGPALELVQRWVAGASSDLRWMKLPAVVGDLGLLAMLARHPMFVVYAWNPLVVSEFAWNGHNDSLVLLMVMAALRWRSFGALGVAVALKWWPAILAPALFRHARWWHAAAIPACVALAAIPFIPPNPRDLLENAQFMSGFVGGWRNNDSLFGIVLWAAGGDAYAAKYATFAALAALALWFARWPIERAWLATLVAVLALSANCHPWYLTWLVPLLVPMVMDAPFPPLLLWTGLAPLGYRVLVDWRLLGEWNGSTPERWLMHAPVAIAATLILLLRWNSKRSSSGA